MLLAQNHDIAHGGLNNYTSPPHVTAMSRLFLSGMADDSGSYIKFTVSGLTDVKWAGHLCPKISPTLHQLVTSSLIWSTFGL